MTKLGMIFFSKVVGRTYAQTYVAKKLWANKLDFDTYAMPDSFGEICMFDESKRLGGIWSQDRGLGNELKKKQTVLSRNS